MRKKYGRKHIGSTFTTNEGYELTVIDGGSKRGYVTIKIHDWISEVKMGNVKTGHVKYSFHKSAYSIGYFGDGEYSRKYHMKIYDRWRNMLKRCYDPEAQERQPTYKGVTVCKDWHNFQVFARWHERYYPEDNKKYDIDKDLKSGESKIYSPETCLFIPMELNQFMTNTRSNNISGHIGVSWDKSAKKWTAQITIDSKNKKLGHYDYILEASRVYQSARLKEVKRWKAYYSFDIPKYVLDKLI